jgi:hypothetical protein
MVTVTIRFVFEVTQYRRGLKPPPTENLNFASLIVAKLSFNQKIQSTLELTAQGWIISPKCRTLLRDSLLLDWTCYQHVYIPL